MTRVWLAAIALFASSSAAIWADDMFQNVQTLAFSDGSGDEISFSRLSPDVMEMDAGETVNLNFGPGYTAELDRVDVQSLGARTWIGRIEGGGIAERVIISELNGHSFGRIATSDGVWLIVPGQNGGHRIFQHPDNAVREFVLDDTIVPTANMLLTEFSSSAGQSSGTETSAAVPIGSNGTIDIAVAYTQSMTDTWGLAVGGRVQYLMALLDQALIDSDTGLRARLVHLSQAATADEAASNTNSLYDFQDGVSSGIPSDNVPSGAGQDFSSFQAIRNAVGADLFVLIRRHYSGSGIVNRTGSSCGAAFLIGSGSGTIDNNSAGSGVAVVSDFINGNDTNLGNGYSFCSDFTLAREIGHNLGFAHNRENADMPGVFDYAYGHRVDCEFVTIMGIGSEQTPGVTCPGVGRNETEAPYFSNPDITLCPNGASCGISETDPDSANNALAARNAGLNVANFQPEAPRVRSAVLPITRSVENGSPASAFATIINPSSSGGPAQGCGLRLAGSTASTFSFQTTDNANALTGTPNTPVDIAAGGSQNFVFSVTSASAFGDNTNQVGNAVPSANDERDLFIEAYCANRRSDEYVLGLNSLTFTSSSFAVADIIALAATVNNEGWINVPTTGNQVGIASVAVTNVGQGAVVTASADTGGQALNIQNIEVCGTDLQGNCVTARAPNVNAVLNTGAVASFAVFVRGNGNPIAADPANNRIFIRFREGGIPRGATSVAVRTQ